MKICVYAISKNEAKFVGRFCDSARDADLILIADTGSTDGLPEKATKHGATVHHIGVNPWRFDLARNTALSLVPTDVDVCISLDIDEVLEPGWRAEIERLWQVGTTTNMRFLFDCGNGIVFRPERIHARNGYMWRHACHETLTLDSRFPGSQVSSDMVLMRHLPDDAKSRSQYMDLLGVAVQEDPNCHRNAFYYAREFGYQARHQECIDAFKRYLSLPGAVWDHERCYAHRAIGRAYTSLGNHYEAEKSFRMATAEAPYIRESWSELAMFMYQQHRWTECFSNALIGLGILHNEPIHTSDPGVWGYRLHDLAAISAFHLGMTEIAIKHGEMALEIEPDDGRIKNNLRFYNGATTAQSDMAAE